MKEKFIESTELKEYIKSSITAIKEGVDGTGFEINKPIEFSLAIINTSEGGGGVKILIAKAEGKLKSEEISHIKFEVQPKTPDYSHQFRQRPKFNKER
jgi:hypothetical protein